MSVSKSATAPVPTKAPSSVPWAGASDDPSGDPASETAPEEEPLPEEEEEEADVPEELELPEPELPLDDVLLPDEEEDDAPDEEEDELPDDVLLAVDASLAPPEPDPPDVPELPEMPQGACEPVVDPQAAQSVTQRTNDEVEGRTGAGRRNAGADEKTLCFP
jgi:hypothetical protein